MDSVLLASNIRQTGRLQLLVEVLQRVHRMLNPGHQTQYAETFAPYVKEHAGHYLYRLKREDYATHMQQIGETMERLLDELRSCYEQETAYQLLTRVFEEHFKLTSETVTPKSAEELSASSLQSPDDWEATYRTKRGKGYQGYVANLSETCDSENPFQLITKVQTAPNLTDDSQLLVEALPNLCERTQLETLYTDGGYGSPQADTHLQEYHIELVQTAIRGRKPDPEKLHLQDFDIELMPDDQTYQVTCPAAQTVAAQPTPQAKSLLARFDPQICTVCPLLHQCPAQPAKRDPSHKLRFNQAEALAAQRHRRHQRDRRCAGNQRAAIEATIRSVKHPFPAGKLPVRGLFRVACMVIGSAALSNLRRICNYLKNQKRAKVTRKNIQKHLNCDQNAALKSFFSSLYNRFYRLATNPGSSISFFPC